MKKENAVEYTNLINDLLKQHATFVTVTGHIINILFEDKRVSKDVLDSVEKHTPHKLLTLMTLADEYPLIVKKLFKLAKKRVDLLQEMYADYTADFSEEDLDKKIKESKKMNEIWSKMQDAMSSDNPPDFTN